MPSIWLSLGSRGEALLHIPVAYPTCRISSPERRTRTKSAVAGFGPAAARSPYTAFYSYAYPEPAGFSQASIKPAAAFYSADLREFVLPYDAVRQAEFPDNTLLEFLQTTYEAAADLANWDRKSLESNNDSKRPTQPADGSPN